MWKIKQGVMIKMDDIFFEPEQEKEDVLKEDEKVRHAYIEATGKYISYGNFRHLHPELLPSVQKASKSSTRVVKSRKSFRLTQEDIDAICEWYRKGYTVSVLASRYLVSEPTIIKALTKRGIWQKRIPKVWTDKEIEIMKSMYFDGLTRKEIACYFGETENTVKYQIKKQGFEAEKRALSGGET